MPDLNYSVVNAGGIDLIRQPTMLETYGWMRQGPDVDDAVVLSCPIDQDVRPGACSLRHLPRGRTFSLTKKKTFVPGVLDDDQIPIACMLIGSDSNSGDVTGGPRIGNPMTDRDAQVPVKDAANAPFWSLGAGYIYETTEFDASESAALFPTTPLTAIHSMDNFDEAGKLKIGQVYVDHIVGVVYESPMPCGVNSSTSSLKLIGKVVPRIPADTVDLLR